MKTSALMAVIAATICMLIYIIIRFRNVAFGASAVLALIHDVLVVATLYALTRMNVGNTFIACMLTIVGYSIMQPSLSSTVSERILPRRDVVIQLLW